MKINVLGTDYTVLLDQELDDDLGGTCDTTSKVIQIAKVDKDDHDKPEVEVERVVRHELVHAFLFESGLYVSSEWACNEEIVDWVALQAPKLFKAFEKATEKSNLGNGEESSLTFDSSGVSLVSENITLNGITQIDLSRLKESEKEIVVRLMLGGKDLKPKLTGRF